ncbi:hypothetical protein OG735_00770 [Streptomyces sp. NBC_01210]|nr:hypothetical protein OG735_00770 [Streptomyces sp. NBC_01210]
MIGYNSLACLTVLLVRELDADKAETDPPQPIHLSFAESRRLNT